MCKGLTQPSIHADTGNHDHDHDHDHGGNLAVFLHLPRTSGTMFGAALARSVFSKPADVCHLQDLTRPTPWPMALTRAAANDGDNAWAAELNRKLEPCRLLHDHADYGVLPKLRGQLYIPSGAIRGYARGLGRNSHCALPTNNVGTLFSPPLALRTLDAARASTPQPSLRVDGTSR